MQIIQERYQLKYYTNESSDLWQDMDQLFLHMMTSTSIKKLIFISLYINLHLSCINNLRRFLIKILGNNAEHIIKS